MTSWARYRSRRAPFRCRARHRKDRPTGPAAESLPGWSVRSDCAAAHRDGEPRRAPTTPRRSSTQHVDLVVVSDLTDAFDCSRQVVVYCSHRVCPHRDLGGTHTRRLPTPRSPSTSPRASAKARCSRCGRSACSMPPQPATSPPDHPPRTAGRRDPLPDGRTLAPGEPLPLRPYPFRSRLPRHLPRRRRRPDPHGAQPCHDTRLPTGQKMPGAHCIWPTHSGTVNCSRHRCRRRASPPWSPTR